MTLADFSQGVVRDAPFHPPIDSVYDAVDYLFDRPPKLRKRGGTTAIFSGSQSASGQTIGAISDAAFKRIYTFGLAASGGSSGAWRYLNPTTAAVTTFASWSSVQGFTRAFQHLGHLLVGLYPLTGGGQSGVIKIGGATGAKIDLTGNTGLIVANQATVGTGGNSTTDMEPGMYVTAQDDSDPTKRYVGRITSLVNASNFTVEPLPTISLSCTGAAGRFSITNSLGNVTVDQPYGGLYGLSWQNRILLFNVALISSDGIVQRFPRTFAYSDLPTEAPAAGPNWTGYTQFYGPAFEQDNTWEIPEIGEITGAALAAEGHLIVFGPRSCYRGVGELSSALTDSAPGTFSVSRVSANVGCISDRSIQYTPQGIVFASQEGVYAFDGNSMQPLMRGRVETTYRAALAAGAKIYGSGYVNGHYYLSMSDHGRLVHLDSPKIPWTRVTNLALFDSVPDPADASKIWGLRWWDQTGAAPSMPGGQAIQLQTITVPSSTVRNDADGTAVAPQVTTRAYDGDDPAGVKRFRDLVAEYAMVNGTSLTVEAAATLDPGAASWTTIGTLSSTSTSEPLPSKLGQSGGAQRGTAVAYRVTQTGASDTTDLVALKPHAERIGNWRAA